MKPVRTILLLLAVLCSGAMPGLAQETPPPAALKAEQIEPLVAPIALYPDALVAQILMASTYPLEVVQADRWIRARPNLKGKALEDALTKEPWEASVKSLTAVPQVLRMMSEKLEWTQKLGDAFLAQDEDVLKAVQTLRARARAAGNLASTSQQSVTTTSTGSTQYIVIESTNPEIVYVPVYNPSLVYGAWPYAAYPPYYYYPPGYVARAGLIFTTGVVVGAALWGRCDWRRGNVNVSVTHYNTFNRTTINNVQWRHNVAHRGAVPYANRAVAQRYNKAPAARTNDAYRGRQPNTPRATGQPAPRPATPNRAGQPAQHNRAQTRDYHAFDGVDKGREAREHSQRGQSSKNSSQRNSAPAGRQGRR